MSLLLPFNPHPLISIMATRVVSSDSGNYSCRPSNAEADMVGVHVLEGTGDSDYTYYKNDDDSDDNGDQS